MALVNDFQSRDALKLFRPRLLISFLLIVLAFGGLVTRLHYLQVQRGEEFANRGRANFIQKVRATHDRGIIYDRHGVILVDNRASLNVEVTPYFLGSEEDADKTLQSLRDLLSLDEERFTELVEDVKSQRGLNRFLSILVKRDVGLEVVEQIEGARSIFELDGVTIAEGKRRTYPHGPLAAHVLGYVNEIDRGRLDRERKKGNPSGYQRGDSLGRSGIEYQYEIQLRGTDGYEQAVVDAKGRRQNPSAMGSMVLGKKDEAAVPGHNVFLSLDMKLQEATESAFDGQAGSVVVMVPGTGEILAMASFPNYDPNAIAGAMARDVKKELDENILKPWLNRSIQGQYAPGSTFKVVTALAALETKTAVAKDEVYCPGYYRLGRRNWRCHRDAGHGHVSLKDALKVSCDTYFYSLSVDMGIDPIAEVGAKLGLGAKTGIPLRGEKVGIMPNEAFHDRVDRKTGGYQKGMALNTSIGQGSVLTTPLQMAAVYSTIANGGKVLEPQLIRRVETADFRVRRRSLSATGELVEKTIGLEPKVLFEGKPIVRAVLDVDPVELEEVRKGLIAVAQEPGGTAYWRRSREVLMAGKTGTAQVVRLGTSRLKAEETAYFERDHAWFVAYAPIDDPQIVVAVINEHSGHGGSKAAPIAVRVIDAWYRLKQERAQIAAAASDQVGEKL